MNGKRSRLSIKERIRYSGCLTVARGCLQIIYPRLISEEEMEASFCRKFATNSLRLKNFVQVSFLKNFNVLLSNCGALLTQSNFFQVPNKRRVSFHDYPEIIGETNSTVNEERVKNLEVRHKNSPQLTFLSIFRPSEQKWVWALWKIATS